MLFSGQIIEKGSEVLRKLVVVSVVLFGSFVLSGCGVMGILDPILNPDRVATPAPHKLPGDFSGRSLEDIAQDISYTCKNASDCQENVVLIVSLNSDGEPGSCTGSFVDDDMIMTNSHCIPAHIEEGGSCEQSIMVLTPGHYPWSGSLRGRCTDMVYKSILSAQNGAGGSPDIAFFKVDLRSPKRPLVTSSEGITDDLELQFYAAQFQGDERARLSQRHVYRQERRDCIAKQGSVLSWGFVHPWTHLVSFFERSEKDCRVLPGNSGSPLMDVHSQQVLGVVQATFRGTQSDDEDDSTNSYVLRAGVATNLACLYVPGTPLTQRNSQCDGHPPDQAVIAKRELLWDQMYGWPEDSRYGELLGLRVKGVEFRVEPRLSGLAEMDKSLPMHEFRSRLGDRIQSDERFRVEGEIQLECLPMADAFDSLLVPRRLEAQRKLVGAEYLRLAVKELDFKVTDPEKWTLQGLWWRSQRGDRVPVCS